MKKVFIIQKFDLKRGLFSTPSVCFSTESEALHYSNEYKRICSETEGIDLDIIDKHYIFSILPLDLLP